MWNKNLDTDIKCKNCNLLINDNLPLNGSERTSIIISFLVFLTPPFWMVGIIMIFSFYIMKKDKKFNSIEISKYLIYPYLMFLMFLVAFVAFPKILPYGTTENSELLLGIFVFCVGIFIAIMIFKILFFDILFNHQKWIINNGLFADSLNDKSIIEIATEKIQTIPKEVIKEEITNKESINSIDELLKWAELKEKGLITEEEFKKVKEKIL